jgi:hypothetical protein
MIMKKAIVLFIALLVLCSHSLTSAENVTPAGLAFARLFQGTVQANPGFPEFLTIFQMTGVAINRVLAANLLDQTINKINAMGELPGADQAELVLEYFLIADIILSFTLSPALTQSFIDGVWNVSVSAVSLPGGVVFPSEIAWRDFVIGLIRQAVNQPPAPPGTGLFEIDPVLVCQTLNWADILGDPNAIPRQCL